MHFEYVISKSTNPYHNLAKEQELMQHTGDGKGILFLWQNDNTIVVGRNQNVESECKVLEFLEHGGKIARRRSGGGAVYHDLGNLNFSILCKSSDRKQCLYQEMVAAVLLELGILAEYNGRNDILISGKKFSGNAIYEDGERSCQHGTILVAADIDKMTYYLTPEQSKLERNHIKSVHSRVLNLSSLDMDIDVRRVQETFIHVAEAEKFHGALDKTRIKNLTDFYKSDAWVMGR